MNQKNHENKIPPKPPEKTAFQGRQLDLFQDFLCNTDQEKDNFSNAIELWDAVPKYHISRRRQNELRTKEGFLPVAVHDFVYRGRSFTVQIRPALLIVNGKNRAFYPSLKEEIIEDALRKLACVKGRAYLNPKRGGVAFTVHELRKELKKRGHAYSYYEVVESLNILAAANIHFFSLDGQIEHTTSPISDLTRVNKEGVANNPNAKWYADFPALVTESIKAIKYRQYNYALMMSHSHQLTRYLHKRLAYNYTQASLLHPYKITMTAIDRDSGLLQSYETRIKRLKIDKSLNELVAAKILMSYDKEETRGTRNALIDIKYIPVPHPNFITDIKQANNRLRMAEAVGLGNRSVKTR